MIWYDNAAGQVSDGSVLHLVLNDDPYQVTPSG